MCDIWVPKCSLARLQLGCWNLVYDTQKKKKRSQPRQENTVQNIAGKRENKYKSIRTCSHLIILYAVVHQPAPAAATCNGRQVNNEIPIEDQCKKKDSKQE